MKPAMPTKMKAVRLLKASSVENLKENLVTEEVDAPTPKAGEVLIKVHYSTVNPSDLAYLNGTYGRELKTPCGVGFEGCGTVVSHGGGMMGMGLGWRLIGKKVAFFSGGGCWAEYTTADAMAVIELPATADLKKCASPLVNPLTAAAFIEIAKAQKCNSLIHTAAASALGLMLIRMAKAENISVICIVRKPEQEQACTEAGAKHVLNINSEDYLQKLAETSKKLNCKLAFDAVSGPGTEPILRSLVDGGTLYIYGALSLQGAVASTDQLIFHKKTVTGFWLTDYLGQKNVLSKLGLARKLPKLLLEGGAHTEYASTVSFEELPDAIPKYRQNMTGGKILIKCSYDAPPPPPSTPAADTTKAPPEKEKAPAEPKKETEPVKEESEAPKEKEPENATPEPASTKEEPEESEKKPEVEAKEGDGDGQ